MEDLSIGYFYVGMTRGVIWRGGVAASKRENDLPDVHLYFDSPVCAGCGEALEGPGNRSVSAICERE